MELQLPSIPVLVTFFLFVFMVVSKSTKRFNSKSSAPNLPPGPWQLPLIGNVHQLLGSLVHHTLRDLAKKYGPLMHLQLGENSTVIVSSPEMAIHFLKTHDAIFANRPSLLSSQILSYNSTNIAFSPYSDYWRQLRKVCIMELLSPKRVQTFRGIREEEVLSLIKSISRDARKFSPINLSKRIFSLTYGITARAAFGKKSRHQKAFISIVEEAVGLVAGFSIADMYPSVKMLELVTGARSRFEKMQRRIDEILETVVNEHKEKGSGKRGAEDLVDVLLRVQKHGDLQFPLTDDNIKAVILDIFGAGSETSSTTVEWAISEMLKNPETMKRAQAEVRNAFDKKGNVDEAGLHELNYLKLVIKETLRLHPSAPLLLPRESSEQCKIDTYDIPPKTRVIVNAWAIGWDPKHWHEPEKFDPERFRDRAVDFNGSNLKYIPFGSGRRVCPGISFALPNVELPLAQLLYHFDWELPGGLKQDELDMTEAFGLTVRRKNDLELIPIPYHGSSVEQGHREDVLDASAQLYYHCENEKKKLRGRLFTKCGSG